VKAHAVRPPKGPGRVRRAGHQPKRVTAQHAPGPPEVTLGKMKPVRARRRGQGLARADEENQLPAPGDGGQALGRLQSVGAPEGAEDDSRSRRQTRRCPKWIRRPVRVGDKKDPGRRRPALPSALRPL